MGSNHTSESAHSVATESESLSSEAMPDWALDTEESSEVATRPARFYRFPWLLVIALVLLLGYFICLANPQILSPYYLIPEVTSTEFQGLVLLFGLYTIVHGWLRFNRHKRAFNDYIAAKDAQVRSVWESKKKIQQKAHVYSSHADKLKFFISDKLLEYIEYDEKFLHFKSIAAEVRHNGVIAYDKVRATLTATQLHFAEPSHQVDEMANSELESAQNIPAPLLSQIEQAQKSMRYLWDLLDLSTADNLALHIANHLITCEEQYCQQQLQGTPLHSAANFEPTFLPQSVIAEYLVDFLADFGGVDELPEQSVLLDTHSVALNIGRFRIGLQATPAVLGNQNHLVLMLENLLKNAMYFHDQRQPKQSLDRIAICLTAQTGVVALTVYNRGPQISEADKSQLFKLGFSTRKAQEHHGKGLGLFFINEVVKGYEGQIQCDNISNPKQTITLRWETDNDVVMTKVLQLEQAHDTVSVTEVSEHISAERRGEQLLWDHAVAIHRLEVSSSLESETVTFADLGNQSETLIADPFNPFMPSWQVSVVNTKRAHKVIFNALDRRGVRFTIFLPDVQARVDDDNPLLEQNFDEEVALLAKQFKVQHSLLGE
ncbi:MAG: GHKL domain-containing protein [Gammaproteobacteria bacterium]|nr:GHKL domain-containing protein [Gammaproteobacteria bacterium]